MVELRVTDPGWNEEAGGLIPLELHQCLQGCSRGKKSFQTTELFPHPPFLCVQWNSSVSRKTEEHGRSYCFWNYKMITACWYKTNRPRKTYSCPNICCCPCSRTLNAPQQLSSSSQMALCFELMQLKSVINTIMCDLAVTWPFYPWDTWNGRERRDPRFLKNERNKMIRDRQLTPGEHSTHPHPPTPTHTYTPTHNESSLLSYSKEKDSSNQPHLTVSVGDLQNKGVEENVDKDLVYSLNDRPPWYMCILLGFQVTWDMNDDATQAFTLVYSPFWCCKPPAFRTVRKFTLRLRLEPESQVTPTRVGKNKCATNKLRSTRGVQNENMQS